MGIGLVLLLLQDVGPLVEKLRSDRVEERQAGEDALVALGEPVLSALAKLRGTADAEVGARLDQVAWRIRWWERTVWASRAAVDSDSGRAVWSIPERLHTGASLARERDVFLWTKGRLERRALRDGARVWEAAARGAEGELHLVGDALLVVGAEGMQAFSPETGRALWPFVAGQEWHARDVTSDGARFLLRTRSGCAFYDASSGKLLWSAAEDAENAAFLPGGDVLIAGDLTTRRCRAADGKVLWSVGTLRSDIGAPLFTEGGRVVTGFGSLGEWTTLCLDPETGATKWSGANLLPSAVAEGPDGRLLMLPIFSPYTPRRDLLVWDAKEARRHPLEGTPTGLRVAGDRVLVTDHRRSCCSLALRAYRLEDGKPLWTADARGIPTEHSKYYHAMRLEVRGSRVVLIGHAAAGDYVEAFRLDTGALVSRWVQPP